MIKLIIKMPTGQEEELLLNEPEYSIGRAHDNMLVLEDTDASRYHCLLRRKGEGYLIEDLRSHNGTYLNGRRIEREALLNNDMLQIGHHLLTYQTGDSASNAPTLPPAFGIEENYDHLITQFTSLTPHAAEISLGSGSMAQMEKEHKTLRLLLDLGNAFSTDLSQGEVCQKATRILLESTEAERAAIFLKEGHEEKMSLMACCERDYGATPSNRILLSRTIAKRILSERKGIITSDAVADERFAHGQSVVASGLHSVACAPLLGKSGDLGVLYMENKTTVGAFTHQDLQLLCAVASQIALAIENARLIEELKGTNENLEHLVEKRTAALADTQLKLYQAEKMASLSRLVAGVAHEINNPLGALKSNLDLLTGTLGRLASNPEKNRVEEGLFQSLVEIGEVSTTACARIGSVVRSLTSFARLDEAAFKMADVNEGIRAIVHLLNPELTRTVRIDLDLGEIPPFPCFPALLNEAFMNLIVNACQSIKGDGKVTIETRRAADEIIVTIRDTGCGIEPERLNKIFDPGFTTRGARVGVGLGLAVVYGVIKEHRGSITAESEVNRGSIFTIRLPVEKP